VVSEAIPTQELEPRLGLIRDVADEIHWTLTKRLGWVGQVLLNLAIAIPFVVATTWNSHADQVKVSGFATSVAGWVLASALNTNQLGFDADRSAASLRAGDTAWRILFLKNLAVLVVLAPPILATTVVLHLAVGHPPDSIPVAMVRDMADVTVWLGFGSLISVLLPFRPLGIRGRWAARATLPRFALCLFLPYAVYFLLLKLWHVPEVALAYHLFHGLSHRHLWDYSWTLLFWGLLTWALGLALAGLYARRFATHLEADLDRNC
jgi:hypothetical protein